MRPDPASSRADTSLEGRAYLELCAFDISSLYDFNFFSSFQSTTVITHFFRSRHTHYAMHAHLGLNLPGDGTAAGGSHSQPSASLPVDIPPSVAVARGAAPASERQPQPLAGSVAPTTATSAPSGADGSPAPASAPAPFAASLGAASDPATGAGSSASGPRARPRPLVPIDVFAGQRIPAPSSVSTTAGVTAGALEPPLPVPSMVADQADIDKMRGTSTPPKDEKVVTLPPIRAGHKSNPMDLREFPLSASSAPRVLFHPQPPSLALVFLLHLSTPPAWMIRAWFCIYLAPLCIPLVCGLARDPFLLGFPC